MHIIKMLFYPLKAKLSFFTPIHVRIKYISLIFQSLNFPFFTNIIEGGKNEGPSFFNKEK